LLLFQGYNTSKTALNALTAHYAYLLKQKKPSSLVLSVCPGFNATSMTDQNSKANSPSHGGAAIVRLVVAGPDSGYKTAEFRDEDGKIKAW
jgi:NAD(P)-dependent dehydrogenase (short-subunit alcohol dehydrogenase family)